MRSEFVPHGFITTMPPSAPEAGVGQPFLRFRLVPDTTALLTVHQMTEVVTFAVGEIVPIPQMPAWVMGVYNWRGEVLWMVDLGHLVGLEPLYQHATNRSTYTAIVIHETQQSPGRQTTDRKMTGKNMLGLVVNRVEDMEWCNPELMQSPSLSAVDPKLRQFLQGYWLKSNGEILVVIDSSAIIASMPK